MMEYKGYHATAELDEDAKVFHGEVLDLRDVVTFEADNVEGLRKAFQDSVDEYLAFCKERGEEPDKSYSGNFVVRVNADLHRAAVLYAREVRSSLNAVVAEGLSSYLSTARDSAPLDVVARQAKRARSPGASGSRKVA